MVSRMQAYGGWAATFFAACARHRTWKAKPSCSAPAFRVGPTSTQHVIIDDDRGHLRRGEIWVTEVLDERSVFFGGQRFAEYLVAGTGREKHDSVTEVDDRHPSAVRKTPSMSHLCGNRHLAALRDQELSSLRRRHPLTL